MAELMAVPIPMTLGGLLAVVLGVLIVAYMLGVRVGILTERYDRPARSVTQSIHRADGAE